jgi:hypothetical protein
MGVQGLRKFMDASGCSRTLHKPADAADNSNAAIVDHVLVDMNGVIHSCYSPEHTSAADTIAVVIERLETLLRCVISPNRSLVLAIDGPAPASKIATQRQRRRKVKHMTVANNTQFCDLSITTGSVFLLQLEQAVARAALEWKKVWLRARTISVNGSAVAGEGEAKISQALRAIAPKGPCNDTVAVVGNDIDLVLTCLGATTLHNLCVVSPSSLQCTDVGLVMKRWCEGDGAFIQPEFLPSARVDFIFMFELNGGDHFDGLGEIAASLWRRYKLLRGSNKSFRVVDPTMTRINAPSLAQLLACDTSLNNKSDPQPALELLDAVLWSLKGTVTGDCPDYQFTPDLPPCSLGMLKAAVLQTQHSIAADHKWHKAMTPLQTFVALMPSKDALPTAVQTVLGRFPDLGARLQNATGSKDVVKVVHDIFRQLKVEDLTAAERFLTQFGEPVDVVGELLVVDGKSVASGRKTQHDTTQAPQFVAAMSRPLSSVRDAMKVRPASGAPPPRKHGRDANLHATVKGHFSARRRK